MQNTFLPVTKEEMLGRGIYQPDFVYVTGDAYVDHPSFGVAIISRMLEDAGYSVAILAQPDYKSCEDFKRFGKPRLGFLATSGNIDSMVAHYSVTKHRRKSDYYSPGGKAGLRPDRAVIVYCNRIREAYGDVPIIIGGLEASLRRFAHYDYWDDKVRRSILVDSKADILSYGMGERSILRIAKLLNKGVPIKKIHDVRGTVYMTNEQDKLHFDYVGGYDYDQLKTDKQLYAKAFGEQYAEQDHINGKAVIERYGNRVLVQNPPQPPLTREELDKVYSLKYMRDYHPMYEKDGGVPAIEEVKFSITHNRGCFGGCNFCALAFHQGRTVYSRSIKSVVQEARIIASMPDFKGYIHDVGGPTANFRYPSCDKQLTHGVCKNKKCLAPTPCKNLKVSHKEYVELLKKVERVEGVKKVFIRSGVRFDYLMQDKDDSFFKKLVRDHVSGQLKVAPEHCCDNVLMNMGKPPISVYNSFRKKYFELNEQIGKEQYLVPYLISSHPGSTLNDAVNLALYLKTFSCMPEQVQDFYPTPGTASTVMFYTGINPLNGKKVYVECDPKIKKMQRALLQYNKRENHDLVRQALIMCGRQELIGSGKNCLVPEQGHYYGKSSVGTSSGKHGQKSGGQRSSNGKNNSKNEKSNNYNKTKTSGGRSDRAKRTAGSGNPKMNGKVSGKGRTVLKDGYSKEKTAVGKAKSSSAGRPSKNSGKAKKR